MKTMQKMKLVVLLLIAGTVAFGQFVFEREVRPIPVPRSAQFSSLTVSQFGDIYLLETKGQEIYRLNSKGEVQSVNGGFGWEEGRFDTPLDINISSGLDLLVADYNNHRIVRFDRELNYLTTYPTPNSDFELSYPRSVVLTNLGEIFILSDENAEIIRLNLNRNNITTFAGIVYDNYALSDPILIRMNEAGILNVLEASGRILQFDRFGTPIGRLKVPAESKIMAMIPVGNDIVVSLRKEPVLMTYSSVQKQWSKLSIEGLPKSTYYISLSYRNNQLYLLSSDGRILICSQLFRSEKK